MRLELMGVKNQSIEFFQSSFMKRQNKTEVIEEKEKNEVISKNEVKTVTETMNNFIEPLQTNLKFEYHEELNEYYVTVINPTTKETIREIPPKKMLDMYAAMVGFMGILIDEKA